MVKYLCVDIQIRGRTVLCKYEDTVIKRALSYAYSILGLSRQGLDWARVARKLWETCAVPAILYCSESSVFRQATLDELEQIQNMVGRFILQVPLSTSRALAWMDAGLIPMRYRILSNQAKFIWNVTHTKFNPLLLVTIVISQQSLD